jgi:large subunit ribosomal protein L7Ae|eukprot:TRINITY_DN1414_c0_g1_i1.p1 TRINITY_DN1414_c0_g1~~TRINITY_DN1414_c0_g1_i1.p1  ORF type:complete len:275 (+),score=71.53 TRINITY_DN1414_c0_g1_i1:671-1495(+)
MPKATKTAAPAAAKAVATKTAAAPYPKGATGKKVKLTPNLFEAKKRNFAIGMDIQPKRDLTRYVKWPEYVRLQRQRRVLYQRLKVPPAINQFTKAADKNLATNVFKLLAKYKPEDKTQKKERLKKLAALKAEKKEVKTSKPFQLKYGINHIATLVEEKKAKLVVIAHDVDPIEIVVWLPALCHRMEVPYVIVKSKARLGQLVHKKTATAVALVDVRDEDRHALEQLVQTSKLDFLDRYEENRKHWGGGVMGYKSRQATIKHQRAIAREEAQRNK